MSDIDITRGIGRISDKLVSTQGSSRHPLDDDIPTSLVADFKAGKVMTLEDITEPYDVRPWIARKWLDYMIEKYL